MDQTPIGTPFSPTSSEEVDEWSLQVFELLASWPIANAGEWKRWEPGYLVLEISEEGDAPIEPIVIDTADEELTVTFGYWEAHLPTDYDADARQAVEEAKGLVTQWLRGEIRTAVFTDASGNWCGSRLVEGDDLLPQLDPEWIRDFNPTNVEVRTPARTNWRQFAINGDALAEITAR